MRLICAVLAFVWIGMSLYAGDAAAAPPPLKVTLIAACKEYDAEGSLAPFKEKLERELGAQCTLLKSTDKGTGIAGLEALEASDVLVLFTRRVTLPPEQLALLKAFLAKGKGLVGIRTASHGIQNYLELDKDILGGSYNGHFTDAAVSVSVAGEAKDHPVLRGVTGYSGPNKLYKNPTLAPDATLLLRASMDKHSEPVAWVREAGALRAAYTSLGTQDDFKQASFQRLLLNAVLWSARREVPAEPPAAGK
jgi:type 1 glutamine amidotransferase